VNKTLFPNIKLLSCCHHLSCASRLSVQLEDGRGLYCV